jgi:dihydrodipicolinate synthase/N-acetylneuraminate lyase
MSAFANGARGEVIAIIAGEPRRLCLTLGALAEMETALAVAGWEALSARLRTLSPGDLLAVLAALLRGGGEHEIAVRLPALPLTAAEAADAIAAAFRASL